MEEGAGAEEDLGNQNVRKKREKVPGKPSFCNMNAEYFILTGRK